MKIFKAFLFPAFAASAFPSAASAAKCNAGEYLDGNMCAPCMSLCITCSNGTSCTSCKSGYILKNGQCEKDPTAVVETVSDSGCPSGTFLSEDGNCVPETK